VRSENRFDSAAPARHTPVVDTEVENPELRMMKKLMLSGSMQRDIMARPPGHQSAAHYHFGNVIGAGSFGKVRLAWHKPTGARVAVKTYKRQACKDPTDWKRIQTESRLMRKINHPNCIRLFQSIETPKLMHMVMDCCSGGSLMAYIKEHTRLAEKEASLFFSQIVCGVEYLHSCNIVHRDLKLENILLDSNRTAKLVDFGFSVVCNNPQKRLKVFCGTPSYMAPELVQRQPYSGKPVDMWSLGVILFVSICGSFPFVARSYAALYQLILRGTYRVPDFVSQSAKDVLHSLLVIDPYRRATVRQVRSLSWVVQDKNEVGAASCTAHLISDNPANDIDEGLLQEMEELGIDKIAAKEDILAKRHNNCTACYYLLRRKKSKGGRQEHTGGMEQQHSNEASESRSPGSRKAGACGEWGSKRQSGWADLDQQATAGGHGGWTLINTDSANGPSTSTSPMNARQRARVERERIDKLRATVVVHERSSGRESPLTANKTKTASGWGQPERDNAEDVKMQLKKGWGRTGVNKVAIKSQLKSGWGRTKRSDLPVEELTSTTSTTTTHAVRRSDRTTNKTSASKAGARYGWESTSGSENANVQPLFMVRSPSRAVPAPASATVRRRV
jgi:serine/threonine protein kinase